MIVVNADDWGRSHLETDAALECFRHGVVTGVSAMVFMEDSERAARLAGRFKIDVGLHLNLTQRFATYCDDPHLETCHRRVICFLTSSKYAAMVYHPLLRRDFCTVYSAQAKEFERLYGRSPSRVDGHHHMHLCANIVLGNIVPAGVAVRRNFSFRRREKSLFNRRYRSLVDWRLRRKHPITDYFFCLRQSLENDRLEDIMELGGRFSVELMTHPTHSREYDFLLNRSQDLASALGR